MAKTREEKNKRMEVRRSIMIAICCCQYAKTHENILDYDLKNLTDKLPWGKFENAFGEH